MYGQGDFVRDSAAECSFEAKSLLWRGSWRCKTALPGTETKKTTEDRESLAKRDCSWIYPLQASDPNQDVKCVLISLEKIALCH